MRSIVFFSRARYRANWGYRWEAKKESNRIRREKPEA